MNAALPLAHADRAAITAHAGAADRAATLTPELRALIDARGWLRMLAPRAAGGAELALPDAVRLEEALAASDGSVGWTVTLCAGAGWFAGFLEPGFAREIVATPAICVAGSGAPSGFADIDGDGFRLNGRWDIATGAPMATHLTMNAVLRQGGVALTRPDGTPLVRAFIIAASDAQLHKTWRSIGLRATASHAFTVDHLRVSARHGFDIDPACATAPGPLYRFPFAALAYVTLAANLSGMALHFLALAGAALDARRLSGVAPIAAALKDAHTGLDAARAACYGLADAMWDQVCRGEPVTAAQQGALRTAALALGVAARRAVDEIYPFCGLHAASEASDINRVWRDLHTATQHAMLVPSA